MALDGWRLMRAMGGGIQKPFVLPGFRAAGAARPQAVRVARWRRAASDPGSRIASTLDADSDPELGRATASCIVVVVVLLLLVVVHFLHHADLAAISSLATDRDADRCVSASAKLCGSQST